MKNIIKPIAYLIIMMSVFINSCTSNTETKNDEHEHQEKYEEHEEKKISLDSHKINELGIKILEANSGEIEKYITVLGEVQLNPNLIVHIVPKVSGIVNQVYAEIGKSVKKNDLMASLESSKLGEFKIEYLSAKENFKIAQAEFEREKTINKNTKKLLTLLENSPDFEIIQKETKGLDMGNNRNQLISNYTQMLLTEKRYDMEKELYNEKVSSKVEFLRAKSEFESSVAKYKSIFDQINFSIKNQLLKKDREYILAQNRMKNIEGNLVLKGISRQDLKNLKSIHNLKNSSNLSRVEIRSPFNGIVAEKHIVRGEFLKNDSSIFVISDLSEVWMIFSIYQKDLLYLKIGQEIQISEKHGGQNVKGKIEYISPFVDEETRTSSIRITIPNKNGLWKPGSFVTGKIEVSKIKSPVLANKKSIQEIEGKKVIFVQKKDGFQPVEVSLGKEDEQNIEIISGLSVGQKYVAQGSFTLKSEFSKDSMNSGHSH